MYKVVDIAVARHNRELDQLSDQLFALLDNYCEEREMYRPVAVGHALESLLNEVSGAAEAGYESAEDVLNAVRTAFFPPLPPQADSPQLELEV